MNHDYYYKRAIDECKNKLEEINITLNVFDNFDKYKKLYTLNIIK